MAIRWHEEAPDDLREAIRFTAEETAFLPRLIEKDYFCTVLLEFLAAADPALVFKGGTCLAKVHAGFYRLSEDLDFVIPVAAKASRAERSRRAMRAKEALAQVPKALPGFRLVEPLTGANLSTQYLGVVAYSSLLDGEEGTIKIEIGLRERLLERAEVKPARSILLDPISGGEMIPPIAVRCIARAEAFAEKFRAALSRREVAIRDFFDLDYAVRRLGLDGGDPRLVRLVRRKLAVPGNDPPDTGRARLEELRRQLDSQLKSVLRERDFRDFDLERAFQLVAGMADRIASGR